MRDPPICLSTRGAHQSGSLSRFKSVLAPPTRSVGARFGGVRTLKARLAAREWLRLRPHADATLQASLLFEQRLTLPLNARLYRLGERPEQWRQLQLHAHHIVHHQQAPTYGLAQSTQ